MKKNKRKKQSKLKSLFGKLFIILLFIIIIFAGIVYGMSKALYNGDVKMCLANIASKFLGGVQTKYVLIMGVSEDIDTELTDTIMVAGYNPNTSKAFLLSIPRDTFVGSSNSSAKHNDKINAKYKKGVENSIQSAEKLTGLKIDGYIVIKTSMLVELVDLIGGVEFDVPINMNYDDPTQDLHIHLSKGVQTIYGKQAEQLLRFRHNNDGTSYPSSYGDNDYGRMRTQREFIKAVGKQTLSFGNITKINGIINAVSDNLITDFKTRELLAYVPQFAIFNIDNLATDQIPGESKKLNGISFFLNDKKATLELVNNLVNNMNTK